MERAGGRDVGAVAAVAIEVADRVDQVAVVLCDRLNRDLHMPDVLSGGLAERLRGLWRGELIRGDRDRGAKVAGGVGEGERDECTDVGEGDHLLGNTGCQRGYQRPGLDPERGVGVVVHERDRAQDRGWHAGPANVLLDLPLAVERCGPGGAVGARDRGVDQVLGGSGRIGDVAAPPDLVLEANRRAAQCSLLDAEHAVGTVGCRPGVNRDHPGRPP
jgi:hypothetical protein